MECTTEENACNETLQKIHEMVLLVKEDREASLEYMKIFEREEMLFENGVEQGIEQGIEQGVARGRMLERISQVRGNLLQNRSLELIADFMGEKLENIELISNMINDNPNADDAEILKLMKEKWIN